MTMPFFCHCEAEAKAIQPQSSLRADEVGAAIHKQKELESTINSLVYTLYNLSDDEITTIDSKT